MSAAVFIAPNRRGDAWFSVGLASSFPDITESGSETVSGIQPCGQAEAPGCKVFQVPAEDSSLASEVDPSNVAEAAFAARDLRQQVLIFQYKGKFHAVNNQCPHSSFPLSNGTPFDIEDFGIVLSAGITCPKHGWSFDLFSGQGDRGNYRLKLWEVQLRPVPGAPADDPEREIWVRKKQRMG
ncbi:putative Rieske domain-containing protein [Seiridium cardinale]|uniref:Rieske domain-containing protein n=1 Tax=Seiridium cardinale TaxID=138064 RepID=A0ABR2XXR6_9PEZI